MRALRLFDVAPGRRHARARRWTKLLRALEAALARGPRSRMALGLVWEGLGDWSRAADAYGRALAGDDRNPNWHARLGRARTRAGRWDDAIDAYQAALACDDRDANWHAQLGRAFAGARRWEEAIDAYEAALARDDRRAKWHAQLGRARAQAQRWAAAAAAYEAAARRKDDPRWIVRAEWALEQARKEQSTTRSHDAGPGDDSARGEERARAARMEQRRRQSRLLSRDPTATELDRTLLAAHPARLPARREVAHTIAKRIDEIRSAAQRSSQAAPETKPRIYVFWAQGIANAPPVVRRCHEELRRLHSGDEVVVLDSSSAGDYVALPGAVTRKLGGDWTKFSDLLRLELLSRYGGIWMDATCLPRVRLLEALPDLLRSTGFFAFAVRRGRPASWFLASEPGNYLATMMREGHYAYWRRFDHAIDYYVFHHIFEALFYVDERFRALWDATPKVPRRTATAFKNAMLGPYDAARFEELLNGCFVHKLSYKSDARALDRHTMLSRLIHDGAPATSPSIVLPQP